MEYTFKSSEGDYVKISLEDLEKYPDSYLTQKAKMDGDNVIKVKILLRDLKLIARFYRFGLWQNPLYYNQRLTISNLPFKDQCRDLGLPSVVEWHDEVDYDDPINYAYDEVDEFADEFDETALLPVDDNPNNFDDHTLLVSEGKYSGKYSRLDGCFFCGSSNCSC